MSKPSLVNCRVKQTLQSIRDAGSDFSYDADCRFSYDFLIEFPDASTVTIDNIRDFHYPLFNIDIITSSYITQRWLDNGYNLGIFGDARRGVGAFFFHDYNLYVDTRGPAGDGTAASPMNYSQLKNYFNPLLGTEIYASPFDGDDISIKGIIDLFDPILGIINIGASAMGTVTVHAWDIGKNGMWIIDATGIESDTFNIVSNVDGHTITELIIKDFIFTKPSVG